jgi:hypothetical protein
VFGPWRYCLGVFHFSGLGLGNICRVEGEKEIVCWTSGFEFLGSFIGELLLNTARGMTTEMLNMNSIEESV